MLDKRTLALLEYINGECGGGYKIFSTEELINALPAVFGADAEGVRECVKTLSERDYISVKYQDEKEVCLSPLMKGRLVFENRIDDEIEKVRSERRYFVFSFVGALSGGVLAGLITAVILFIFGVR